MKKTLKKIVALTLVVALVATASVFGTLAYLQDTDEAVNVATVGNVKIEQIELQRAEGVAHTGTLVAGKLVPFVQGQNLYPAYAADGAAYTAEQTELLYWGPYVTAESDGAGNGLWNGEKLVGAMDKFVFVENTGRSDCYYRTWFAFECPEGMEYSAGSDKEFMMNVNGNTRFTWTNVGYEEIDDVRYLIMCATYNNVLPAGKISRPSLLQVVMTDNVTSEQNALLGGSYEILTFTQAVQTENMPDAKTALVAAFGTAHPWVAGEVKVPVLVETANELAAAIAEGEDVILTANINAGTVDVLATVATGEDVVVDLNGHDITATLYSSEETPTAVFNVRPDATLTVTGEGTFAVTANKSLGAVSAIINNEAGNVVIEGGKYTMTYGSYDEGYLIPTIVDNNSTLGAATVTINGGEFYHTRNMLRNFSNNKTEKTTIIINGGTFAGEQDDDAAIWNQKPSAGAVNGYVIVNGGTFNYMCIYDEFSGNVTINSNISYTTEVESDEIVYTFN